MDTQEEIKQLKKRIAELELAQEFPQQDNTYWYVSMRGNIFTSQWEGFPSEVAMLKFGNIFINEDQAKFAVEKLKAETELRKFSSPFKDNDNNYYIEIYLPDKKLSIDRSEYFKTQGAIYFESRKVANEAIEAVGEERIKKYIFGVEE